MDLCLFVTMATTVSLCFSTQLHMSVYYSYVSSLVYYTNSYCYNVTIQQCTTKNMLLLFSGVFSIVRLIFFKFKAFVRTVFLLIPPYTCTF